MGDFLLLLGGLALISLPFAVIYLLVVVAGLRRRIEALETRAAGTRAPASSHPMASPAPMAAPAIPTAELVAPPASPLTRPDAKPQAEAAGRDPWSRTAPTAAPPEAPAPKAPLIPATSAPSQSPALVFSADRIGALGRWLVQNWVYAISALSLGLAGIFLVQYGAQQGLLPPPLRVLAALALGGGLIKAGEWLRHRHGDAEGATIYLPSTFSGAGISILFAALLAARQMYGLIGPTTTFAGLLLTAAGALYLGWRHTPVLAAMGLIGATLAPFLVGGSANSVDWLYAYAGLIAAVGLGIDAFRRWAWVSVLALALGFGLALLVRAGGGVLGLAMLALAMPALAYVIPSRRLMPVLEGASVAGSLARALRGRRGKGARPVRWPAFPVRLMAGTLAFAVLILVGLGDEGLVALVALALLAAVGAVWTRSAPAISDLMALPVLGFVLALARLALAPSGAATDFFGAATDLPPPEAAVPLTVTLLVALAGLMAGAAGYRAITSATRARYWAVLAAVILPASGFVLELLWRPALVLGSYPWALHAMAAAAGMTVLAVLLARIGRLPGAAYATLSALVLIAFALFVTLTSAALTVALAALLLAAAALDRRFDLPEMAWFLQAGVAVLGWRLVADPGLSWGIHAPLWEVLLAYGGAALAAGLALHWQRARARRPAEVVLDSALWVFVALLVDLLIYRATDALVPAGQGWGIDAWRISLLALPWLALALGQLARRQLGGRLRHLRLALAVVSGGAFAAGMALAVLPANPAVGLLGSSRVYGPPLLDTLFLAYGLPGLVLILAPRVLARLGAAPANALRRTLLAGGAGVLLVYALLEIRSWFHGRDLDAHGFTQGELSTYTLALMLTGAALLWQAIARRSDGMRRLAMAVIGVTVAKVFLVDAAGLTGLMRVASFLGLGLSLAGLAWLNRWVAARQGPDGAQD